LTNKKNRNNSLPSSS